MVKAKSGDLVWNDTKFDCVLEQAEHEENGGPSNVATLDNG